MSETFSEFLNRIQADSDSIQQAFRLHLSEHTDDPTREEMLAELRSAATSEGELERQLKALQQDPMALEQAALAYFEHAWDDDPQQPSIRAAFEHAKASLPVVEAALLAVVAMYGMYLIATDGVSSITRTTIRNPDGRYVEIEEKKVEPFAPIVSAMMR